MTGREAMHAALHESACPVEACASCAEMFDPSDVGRIGSYITRTQDVAIWLKYELPEYWWGVDGITVARVAGWLTYRTSGERIETPDEPSVFELFGLPYQDAWERE
jgi:hypothetical protein